MKFAGVFKDDSDFAAIMESIRAERTSDDEAEVDPSYYLMNCRLLGKSTSFYEMAGKVGISS